MARIFQHLIQKLHADESSRSHKFFNDLRIHCWMVALQNFDQWQNTIFLRVYCLTVVEQKALLKFLNCFKKRSRWLHQTASRQLRDPRGCVFCKEIKITCFYSQLWVLTIKLVSQISSQVWKTLLSAVKRCLLGRISWDWTRQRFRKCFFLCNISVKRFFLHRFWMNRADNFFQNKNRRVQGTFGFLLIFVKQNCWVFNEDASIFAQQDQTQPILAINRPWVRWANPSNLRECVLSWILI